MNAANMPGLLIRGDNAHGAIVTAETAAGMQALWPQLQTVSIANAGHNVRRDNLTGYVEAVGHYLEATA
jgi:pimeloyl-ACP methyl ester carboxylesterase